MVKFSLPWRRSRGVTAQVWKKGGDLHHESGFYALQRRRSPRENLTCAKNGRDLHQTGTSPAPKMGETCAYEHSEAVSDLKENRIERVGGKGEGLLHSVDGDRRGSILLVGQNNDQVPLDGPLRAFARHENRTLNDDNPLSSNIFIIFVLYDK